MKQKSFFTNLLTSGHYFKKNEILLKFQYRIINTILIVMGFFTFSLPKFNKFLMTGLFFYQVSG